MDRQEIVRILIADLTNKTGDLYPTSALKESLAESLVIMFPCLGLHRHGVTPYCHFYHPRTGGFFENRLRTMRKSLSPGKRKRSPNSKKDSEKNKKQPLIEGTDDIMMKVFNIGCLLLNSLTY